MVIHNQFFLVLWSLKILLCVSEYTYPVCHTWEGSASRWRSSPRWPILSLQWEQWCERTFLTRLRHHWSVSAGWWYHAQPPPTTLLPPVGCSLHLMERTINIHVPLPHQVFIVVINPLSCRWTYIITARTLLSFYTFYFDLTKTIWNLSENSLI